MSTTNTTGTSTSRRTRRASRTATRTATRRCGTPTPTTPTSTIAMNTEATGRRGRVALRQRGVHPREGRGREEVGQRAGPGVRLRRHDQPAEGEGQARRQGGEGEGQGGTR